MSILAMRRLLKRLFSFSQLPLVLSILLHPVQTLAAEAPPKPVAVAFIKDETLFDEGYVTPATISGGSHKTDLLVSTAASETIVIIANNITCRGVRRNFAAGCYPENNGSSIIGMNMQLPTGNVFEWKEESHNLYARGSSANSSLQLRTPGSLEPSVDISSMQLYYTTPAESNLTFGYLGLGMKSTLLQSLASTRRISSNAYGLYLGAEIKDYAPRSSNPFSTPDTSYPGSLVLGGYDRNLLAGDVIGGRLSGNKFPRIEISEVTLHNTREGGEWPESTEPIVLDVDSTTAEWELPSGLVTKLAFDIGAQLGGGYYGYNRWGGMYVGNVTMKIKVPSELAFSDTENSKLTMKTVREIKITIPGSEWYQLHPINYVSNKTISRAKPRHYIPLTVASKRFVAGRAFLRSMYLVVDYDKGEFYLGPTSWRPENSAQNLTPIVSPWYHREPKPNRVGPILGGTLGGILFLVGLLGGTYLWRRRKMGQMVQASGPGSGSDNKRLEGQQGIGHELEGSTIY